jgi:membrane protease YdiL (CAAX protease family)
MTSTPPALPAPSRPAAAWLRWAFLGPDSARAGWRCLLYGLTVFGFGLIMAYIGSHLGKLPKGELAPHLLIISDGLLTSVVTLATAVMAWIEGKRLRDYGLGGPHLARNFFIGLAGGFGAGVLFCVLVHVSGSLWLGIGFQAAWDWAQSFFYGLADSGTMLKGHLLNTHAMGAGWLSGGTTGPEGSVLDMPITLLGLLALIWVYRPRGAAVLAGTPAYS